jgi:hypothetical protein
VSQVAEVTGGEVNKVDPLKLAENFSNVLEKPIIATQVQGKRALSFFALLICVVCMQLHSGMYFRNVEQVSSIITQEVSTMIFCC